MNGSCSGVALDLAPAILLGLLFDTVHLLILFFHGSPLLSLGWPIVIHLLYFLLHLLLELLILLVLRGPLLLLSNSGLFHFLLHGLLICLLLLLVEFVIDSFLILMIHFLGCLGMHGRHHLGVVS